jgi:biopolymer transport protein ExbD
MAGAGSQEVDDAITGINVTPLVDITLVLLIIFMVTTSMIVRSQAVQLDLPKAANGTNDVQAIFNIILTADGRTLVDSKVVPTDEAIGGLAKEALSQHPDLRAVIKADAAVQHGRVIHVLDLLKSSHVNKIAFGTQQPTPVQH